MHLLRQAVLTEMLRIKRSTRNALNRSFVYVQNMFPIPIKSTDDIISLEYKPNMYVGPLLQKTISITEELKLQVQVDQQDVKVDEDGKTTCTYKIRIREIKQGETRTFLGYSSLYKKRMTASGGCFHFVKFGLSNFWVHNEPCKYVATLRFIFNEPCAHKFRSSIKITS